MQPASFASVLVIDDEPVVLDLFQRVLTEKGLSTRLARNAEEALALLEREEFGCVLADKNLPGLNGIEVLRRVRHATTDLRRRSLHLLSRLVASKAAGREVLLSGEALLDELRRIREAGQPPAPELRRIEEKLEEHLALARHAQSR